MGEVAEQLLGRSGELDLIRCGLETAAGGTGSTVLLAGPAGIGKTALTRAAVELAGELELQCLNARGNDGETGLAFGVVRQLVDGQLRRDADLRETLLAGSAALAEVVFSTNGGPSATVDPYAVLHGLFWVCSNLAERQPLLLIVDDLHWADPASLRFVGYLANRVVDLPCLLLLGHRTGEPVDHEHLDPILTNPDARVVDLSPLRPEDSAALIRAECGPEADDAFCSACHAATGGNPFLLRELARTISLEGIAPTKASANRISTVTPAGVARWVAARLGRLPAHARALAGGIAVVGSSSEQHLAARVAGLEPVAAAEAADALAAAGLVAGTRTLEFVHPLIRTAIYEQLGPGGRARAHAIVADALAEVGGSSEHIGMHLLHVPPRNDPDRARVLVKAGEEAVSRGAPEAAVGYLRRALEEPPSVGERGGVLFDLGRAEAMLAANDSLEHLSEAVELAAGLEDKVAVLRETAYAMAVNFGLMADAYATMGQARELVAGHGAELELRLHAEHATFAVLSDEVPIDLSLADLEEVGELKGETTGERAMLALLAWCRLCVGQPASRVRPLAAKALAAGRLLDELGSASLTAGVASWSLAHTLSRQEIDQVLPVLLRTTRRTASRHGIGLHTFAGAAVARESGRLRDAEALVRESIDAVTEVSSVGLGMTLALYVDVQCDLGESDAAWRELEALGFLGDLPPFFPWSLLLLSRGRLRALRGDLDAALEDIGAAASRFQRWRVVTPALAPWRSASAEVHLRAGERDRAAALLLEELDVARAAELDHVVGRDLRLLAACEEGEDAIARLHDAIAVLGRCGARHQHAHALIDLGAALRRDGRRGAVRGSTDDAREALRAGIDLAHHCGAASLVEHGQAELRATGARPRRLLSTGPDSLTASERRVAQLAAEGMSNRDIAGALFVTLKTVEKHLGNAYAKLEISSRHELRRALGD